MTTVTVKATKGRTVEVVTATPGGDPVVTTIPGGKSASFEIDQTSFVAHISERPHLATDEEENPA